MPALSKSLYFLLCKRWPLLYEDRYGSPFRLRSSYLRARVISFKIELFFCSLPSSFDSLLVLFHASLKFKCLLNDVLKIDSLWGTLFLRTFSFSSIDLKQTFRDSRVFSHSSRNIIFLNHCEELVSFLFHSVLEFLNSFFLKSYFVLSLFFRVVLNLIELSLSWKFHSVIFMFAFELIKVIIKEVFHELIGTFSAF